MTGLYLYCVRNKMNVKLSGQGIGKGEIYTIPYKDLEAVVSEVDLEEFGSNEIQKRAQEDLKWIGQKVQIHEKVVEAAMRKNKKIIPVIPMKFGTIFKTKERLIHTLKKHYSQFRENLKNLAGKQEWSVKVYLDRKRFEEEDVKKKSSQVKQKQAEISQLPEGMAYFMQKQVDEVISKEADKTLEKYGETFFGTLKQHATAGTKGKILEKEITGESLPMVLNMIFLVSERKLKDFVKKINKLGQEFKNKGFVFEYSGPWPPYNFV